MATVILDPDNLWDGQAYLSEPAGNAGKYANGLSASTSSEVAGGLKSTLLPEGLDFSGGSTYFVVYGTPTVEGTYSFTVSGVDPADEVEPKTFEIVVNPLRAPKITADTNIDAVIISKGYYFGEVDAIGGDLEFSATGLPDGFEVQKQDSGYANIQSFDLSPSLAGQSFPITVMVSNAAGTDTLDTTLYFYESADEMQIPSISTTPDGLPAATVDEPYYFTLASDGSQPIRWYAYSQPEWLTVSADGIISGTPTESGAFVFFAGAQNAAGSNEQELDITVVEPAHALEITTEELPAASTATRYGVLIEASGGTAPYSWELDPSSTLPAGLVFTTADGDSALEGTATATGTFDGLIFTVTDAVGATASKTFSLEVVDFTPVVWITDSLPDGVVGRPYFFKLQAAGGSGPLAFASGTFPLLPSGLDIDYATGTISGIPTEATNPDDPYQVPINVYQVSQPDNDADRTFTISITEKSTSYPDDEEVLSVYGAWR